MKKQDTDWEVLILAVFVFALGMASLWEALLPRLPVVARDFLLTLGLLLALLGVCAIYVDLGWDRSGRFGWMWRRTWR